LRPIAKSLSNCPDATLQVWGHADGSTGNDRTNLALSRDRAQNTVAAFAAMGFSTDRVEVLALGATRPAAEGDTDSALDRRVEFKVIPTSQ
jgi:outer membrane protein OmpA-like peptidoglycan-associated protein